MRDVEGRVAAVALVEAVAGEALNVAGVVLEARGAEVAEGAADLAFRVVDYPVSVGAVCQYIGGEAGKEGQGCAYLIRWTTSDRSKACWRALVNASASCRHSPPKPGVERMPQMAHEGCQSIAHGFCASDAAAVCTLGLRSRLSTLAELICLHFQPWSWATEEQYK